MNQPAYIPQPLQADRRYHLRVSAQLAEVAIESSRDSEPEISELETCEPKTSGPEIGSKQAFLGAMSCRVSSVNLVATDGVAGRFGMTVTSMCSVSAEPPLLMIGINRNSPLCQAISGNGCFVINVLSIVQKYLADSFAGMGVEQRCYDFSQARWYTGITGAPILAEGAASFECELASYQDVGSHRMFLGRVIEARQGSQPALCYSERSYKRAHSIETS